MNALSSVHLLHQLARLYGIQTAYYDVNHHRQRAPEESLLAVLRSMGSPLKSLQDVPSAWHEQQKIICQRVLEPVIVAWNGKPLPVEIHLPISVADASIECRLMLESGEHLQWQWHGTEFPASTVMYADNRKYAVKPLPLPDQLPWGYHRLALDMQGECAESLIISAPDAAYTTQERQDDRGWGIFLPLYALHAQRSWGSGSFSDLGKLINWTAEMGGSVVATLPLMATFLDNFFEPSPYLPTSRLFWSEFYLDINALPELQECHSAQALMNSPAFHNELKYLRSSGLVDYRRQMELKRGILEKLCHCLFAKSSRRLEELYHFVEANPAVEDYARFRATCERQRSSWQLWPRRLQESSPQESDYDEETNRYHLYAQWLAHQQMTSISQKARQKGLQLYLDFPLGVHPNGYDAWHEREIFIPDISVGAPVDAVFTSGQNWAFPPLHPHRIREQGYSYLIACLRHHLHHAGILRIDHVMGIHRLFFIPKGMENSRGVYVRYRAEEIYAILSLESHRYKVIIAGEDMGTVPSYVRPAMRNHEIQRMYVMQYELAPDPSNKLPPAPSSSIASLNTHDMPPFAAFWQNLNNEGKRRIDLLNRTFTGKEKELPSAKKALAPLPHDANWLHKATSSAVSIALTACLSFLATSRARVVLINMEDLWLETQPQNIPGTSKEYPNWQRKTRYTFERFCRLPQVVDILKTIDELRRRSKHRGQ